MKVTINKFFELVRFEKSRQLDTLTFSLNTIKYSVTHTNSISLLDKNILNLKYFKVTIIR